MQGDEEWDGQQRQSPHVDCRTRIKERMKTSEKWAARMRNNEEKETRFVAERLEETVEDEEAPEKDEEPLPVPEDSEERNIVDDSVMEVPSTPTSLPRRVELESVDSVADGRWMKRSTTRPRGGAVTYGVHEVKGRQDDWFDEIGLW